MSTVEQAVRERYGIKLPPSPGDGRHRAFVIDQFRNGYLLKLSSVACYGSIIDGECFIWQNGESRKMVTGQRDSADIRNEWLVWRIAKAQVDRGEKLSVADAERLALAVQRLESWL